MDLKSKETGKKALRPVLALNCPTHELKNNKVKLTET
jgi:hypothetical protein